MKKISNILLRIFAYGITICLFAGGATFLGYVAALVIGGENATNLCVFLHKTFLPYVIQFTSIFTGIGLVGMYLSRVKALSISNENMLEK